MAHTKCACWPVMRASAMKTANINSIQNNIININVNGMVCDFCAQSIEKVFMKRIEVKGINVNLEDQKVVIYLEKETDIENTTISTIFEDAGYTVETINRNS